MKENNVIGNIMRKLRKEHDLTLRELGVKTGLTTQYICDLESGRIQSPSLKKLSIFAEAFNLSVIDILLMAGYTPSIDKTDLENAILTSPDLSPAGREALLSTYRAVRNK